MSTLDALFSWVDEDELREPLERFIARALCDAGVWPSTRTSDGITKLRVVGREPTCLRVCGELYEIDQTEHSFWLDVERGEDGDGLVTWSLFFDADLKSMSDRRARLALDSIQHATDVEWSASLTGAE